MERALKLAWYVPIGGAVIFMQQYDSGLFAGFCFAAVAIFLCAGRVIRRVRTGQWRHVSETQFVPHYCYLWFTFAVWQELDYRLVLGPIVAGIVLLFAAAWLMDRADVRRAIRAGMGPKNSHTTQPRYRFDDD
jgi:uncharacterized membrane protein YoaT (DUF817 family)